MDELVFWGRIAVGLAVLVVAYALMRRRLAGGMRLASVAGGRGSQCPHLGLASDPFKRLEHAGDEHRCYAHLSRERVDLTHQRQFCLSSTYAQCPFLTVKPREEGLLEQMRVWWRSVSPVHPTPAQHGPRAALGGSHGGRGAAVGTLLVIAQRALATSRAWLATAGVAVASQSGSGTWRGAREGVGRPFSSRWAGVRDQSPSAVLRDLLAIGRQTAIALGILLLRFARWAGPQLVVLARWAAVSITKRHRSARLSARLAATPRPSAAVQLLASSPGAAPAGSAQSEPAASAPTSWQDVEDAMRVETIVPADPKGPGLLNRVAAHKQDLVERGIAAVEAGREAEAYAHFKRATELDPRALRAWFWRAKTAETLDEVITCLERAKALEPSNSQIASNLSWAVQRREAARTAAAAVAKKAPAERSGLAVSRGPGLVYRVGRLMLGLSRGAAALAAFLVGATWLVSALPGELRQAIGASLAPLAVGASDLRALPLPGPGVLTSLVHLPQVAGYDLGSSLPYGIGFLALFVGLGLLGGDTWTRLWAPLLGVGSAYVWSLGAPAELAPYILPTCAIVAVGGVLAGDWLPRNRFRYRARRSALQSG